MTSEINYRWLMVSNFLDDQRVFVSHESLTGWGHGPEDQLAGLEQSLEAMTGVIHGWISP